MGGTWLDAIDERSAAALASGALQPVQAEQTEMEDGGMRFIVRWVSSLAVKDAAKVAIPGGPRDPNFNPFLNPDPALTVGPVGDAHVVILNKFPLCERHLVLARRTFEEQLQPLEYSDFAALATIMVEAGGIGLYNGGAAAGASQRHKHVQWMPEAEGNASLRLFAGGLPLGLPEQGVATHPALPMKHVFVRVLSGRDVPVEAAADSLLAGYRNACDELGLVPGEDGLLPPCNLLVGEGWLLMLPRSQECFEGISISAVCFGGTLYTRQPEQIEAIRRVGPLRALAAVGC
ncbi:ATP adenylyltransferase family protein [Thauera humireducens]|uniref:Phosphorylase n=1 Tax=Thauera humireducens TaxID=1134435 RepID=A0A127K6S4_9RHOO|nr:phosphorylase [Thauera humireducens]AMO37666.1 phosphorylase [Thauera humireducens]